MDQPAKEAHGSLYTSCNKAARFPSGRLGGKLPKAEWGFGDALFQVEVLKTVLRIHHPQREALGGPPWREGSVQQLDPQQLPGKNNPEGTWINKIHFASPNITLLSSCSPSNVLIPFQPFSVFLPASVRCFPCFFYLLYFFFLIFLSSFFHCRAASSGLSFSLSHGVFTCFLHNLCHLVHFLVFPMSCLSLSLSL